MQGAGGRLAPVGDADAGRLDRAAQVRELRGHLVGPTDTGSDGYTHRFFTTPHSVVTVHLIDRAGEPTVAARDEILAFFHRRLA